MCATRPSLVRRSWLPLLASLAATACGGPEVEPAPAVTHGSTPGETAPAVEVGDEEPIASAPDEPVPVDPGADDDADPLAGIEQRVDEALRDPRDPEEWSPLSHFDGREVETRREFDPSGERLMRIYTALPGVDDDLPVPHGPDWRYFDSGLPSRMQYWLEGVAHGPQRSWWRTGQVREEASFAEGVRVGTWTRYGKMGQRMFEGRFVAGKPDGDHRSWFGDGQLEDEQGFASGVQHGRHRTWSRTGILLLDERWSDGALHGPLVELLSVDGAAAAVGRVRRGSARGGLAYGSRGRRGPAPPGDLRRGPAPGADAALERGRAARRRGTMGRRRQIGPQPNVVPDRAAAVGGELRGGPARGRLDLLEPRWIGERALDRALRERPTRPVRGGTLPIQGNMHAALHLVCLLCAPLALGRAVDLQEDRDVPPAPAADGAGAADELPEAEARPEAFAGFEAPPEQAAAPEGGVFTRFHHGSGAVAREGYLVEGVRAGVWTGYRENGVLAYRGGYSNYARTGNWIYFDEVGNRDEGGPYVAGRRTGLWVNWFKGRLAAGPRRMEGRASPRRVAPLVPQRNDGELDDLPRRAARGGYRRWTREGKVAEEGRYDAGEKVGVWTKFTEAGEPESRGSYTDGVQDGEWVIWHPGGQRKAVGSYVRGAPDGEWRGFHPNGQRSFECRYELGQIVGSYREWHPSGQAKSEGAYVDGLMEGEWKFWTRDGQLDPATSGVYSKGTLQR